MIELYTEAEKAYLAGLFDGEGSISIYKGSKKRRKNHTLWLDITNTNYDVIDWCKKTFRMGSIRHRKEQKPNRKSYFRWLVSAAQAENVLCKILPYLIIKKERAEVALKFRALNKPKLGRKLTTQEIQEREDFRFLMKKLNRKGKEII